MGLLNIFPSGELNKDSDKNVLPEGDYSDARNIILKTSKTGGMDSIKVLESIKTIGLATVSGLLKTVCKAPNGIIYELYRDNSTTASIYSISINRQTRTKVLTYLHNNTTDFTPDLKAIGNNLVWNYYGSGKLLYWDITRVNDATPILSDLLLAKAPPVNAYAITKQVVANESVDLLELNDFQFASRYKYDNGEYSTLSSYSLVFKGQKSTSSYTFTFNNTNKPTFAKEIDLYCRIGNFGTWRRILTATVDTVPSNFVWKGQFFETLSEEESNEIFSAVPDIVGSIEVAIDRIFIADYVDDFNNDSVGSIVMSASTGYTLPTGGTIKNYFGGDTTDAGIKSQEEGTFYKPFANNSQYSIGLLFFDSSLKTRGVEFATPVNTGLFSSPIAPTININTTGYTKPSYAKWIQLCITKNLSKSRTFEGYASSIYFEVEEETSDPITSTVIKVIKNKLSVKAADLTGIKNLVLDISGMYKSGYIYNYQNGDRILVNVPDGVAQGSTFTGAYRVLDLQVNYGDSERIYCNWIGGECLNDDTPDASKLFFEVYSIRQQSEEANTLFYGIGDLIDVSSAIPSTITNYQLGDTVFKKLEFSQYTQPFLQKGKIKSKPAVVQKDARTFVKAGKAENDTASFFSIDITNDTLNYNFYPALSSFGGSNEDSATTLNGGLILSGFYDFISEVRFKNNFDIVEAESVLVGDDETGIQITIFAYLVKRSFNQETQSFGAEQEISKDILIYSRLLLTDEFGLTDKTVIYSDDSEFVLKPLTTFSAGDEVKVKYKTFINKTGSGYFAGLIELRGKTGFDNTITLSVLGDRISTNDAYFAKSSVPVATTKTAFVVRAMSNSIENLTGWNLSTGKPYIRTTNKISQSIINGVRSSGNLIFGTDVNNIGKFSVMDSFDVPIENGRIVSLQRASRLQGDGDMLLAICTNETSYVLLGESSMNQSSNSEFRALSAGIIGSIRNLGNRVGVSDKESVYNYDGDIYWWSNELKKVCQFTKEGLKLISDKKMKSEFILKSGKAKIAVDPFYEILLINFGTESIGYDIESNKWCGFFDIAFDFSVNDGEQALFFKDGIVYRSLESASGNKYGEYIGTTYPSYISLSANSIIPIMPQNVIIHHSMNVIDYNQPNKVKASLLDIVITNENEQESDIKEVNFLLENNKLYAHVLRDKNGGGLVNGRYIIGYSNIFKLSLKDYSQENRIFAFEIGFDNVTGH